MTLSPITIPTSARGAVRAFVKSLPGFDAWCASQGIASRDVKNADLIEYADKAGKLDVVRALIANALNQPADLSGVNEVIDASIEKDLAVMTSSSVFAIDAVLAGVDQFLSPLVRKELAATLQPLVDAANKPEVVREVEKVVTIEAAPVAPAGKAPYAQRTGGKVEFNKLFGVRTTYAFGKTGISLWNAHGQAPMIDPFYVVDAVNMGVLATAAEHETNVWLVGPSGSGKTTLPMMFAAFTGRPFVKIDFSRQTEVADLTGGQSFAQGQTGWDDGVLIQAMKSPGTVILLDEPTFAPPGVQAIIQSAADNHRTYTIHSTGEVVKCAPGVFFVVADNTNGSGDETGQYAGTNQSNAALVNRFPRMIRVEYLTRQQETTALMNHVPGMPQVAAEHVTEFVSRARKLPEMEGIALSLRQMVGFVKMVKDGFPAKIAFEASMLTRLPATERAAIETMATLQWGEAFERLLSGSAAVVEPSSMPSSTPAGRAFDDDVSASFTR